MINGSAKGSGEGAAGGFPIIIIGKRGVTRTLSPCTSCFACCAVGKREGRGVAVKINRAYLKVIKLAAYNSNYFPWYRAILL